MRLLYLVRHASPAIKPDQPARDWPLSERGVDEARALASIARDWGLAALYSSSESKAQTTALILGDAAGLSVNVIDAFDELRVPWIGNADAFNDAVRAILLDQPAIRGAETAETAAARFASGVQIVTQGSFPAAIVSHGRILAAWLTRAISLEDPFDLWRKLPFAGYACVDLDALNTGFIRPFQAPS